MRPKRLISIACAALTLAGCACDEDRAGGTGAPYVIAYAAERGIHEVLHHAPAANGVASVRLGFAPDAARDSLTVLGATPDGATAFVARGPALFAVRGDQEASRIADVDGRIESKPFAVSPDGRKLLFKAGDHLHLLDLEAGVDPTVILQARRLSGAAFTPDGRYVLATLQPLGEAERLAILPSDGSDEVIFRDTDGCTLQTIGDDYILCGSSLLDVFSGARIDLPVDTEILAVSGRSAVVARHSAVSQVDLRAPSVLRALTPNAPAAPSAVADGDAFVHSEYHPDHDQTRLVARRFSTPDAEPEVLLDDIRGAPRLVGIDEGAVYACAAGRLLRVPRVPAASVPLYEGLDCDRAEVALEDGYVLLRASDGERVAVPRSGGLPRALPGGVATSGGTLSLVTERHERAVSVLDHHGASWALGAMVPEREVHGLVDGGWLVLWDTTDGQSLVLSAPLAEPRPIELVPGMAARDLAVNGGYGFQAGSGTLRQFNLSPPFDQETVATDAMSFFPLEFPAGTGILTRQSSLRFHGLEGGVETLAEAVDHVAFDRASSQLAWVTADELWWFAGGTARRLAGPDDLGIGPSVRFLESGRFISVVRREDEQGLPSHLRVYSTEDRGRDPVEVMLPAERWRILGSGGDVLWLTTSRDDDKTSVWAVDLGTGDELHRFELPEPGAGVRSAAVSPTGQAIALSQGSPYVWQVTTGLQTLSEQAYLPTSAWSADGERLLYVDVQDDVATTTLYAVGVGVIDLELPRGSPGRQIDALPDGRFVVALNDRIFIIGVDASTVEIAPDRGPKQYYGFALLP